MRKHEHAGTAGTTGIRLASLPSRPTKRRVWRESGERPSTRRSEQGALKSVKIGKRRLITIEALRAWLLAHEVAA